PIPWFLLACAVYFGVGPLVYYFGNDASIEFVNSFFPVDPESLLRSHLLNSIAMTIISGTTIIVESFLPKTNALPQQPLSDATYFRCLLWAFLLIGLSVEILLVLPYKIGLLSWTLPGSVQYLSTFSKLAIIMLFALVYKCGATHYRLLLYPLIFI